MAIKSVESEAEFTQAEGQQANNEKDKDRAVKVKVNMKACAN